MTIATTYSRTLLPRTDDMRSMLEDMEAASARLAEEYIPTPRPLQTARPAPAPPPSPAPSPRPGPNLATQAVGTLVGTVTGLAVGAHRVLLGGCAGGAQGVVTASGADSDEVFQATLAVNLAATGALAGRFANLSALALGTTQSPLAGALANLVSGTNEWTRAPETFKTATREAAAHWVKGAVQALPFAEQPLLLPARALAGELIGGVAGVSTAVLAFPEHYQEAFQLASTGFMQIADPNSGKETI